MKLLVMAGLVLSLTGCASILNDQTQKINIASSNNTEFKGTINGIPFSAPSIVEVTRTKGDKVILVDNPKCVKQTLLKSKIDGVFWINILTGGTFGSTTDYSTEKMWGYDDSVLIPCKDS